MTSDNQAANKIKKVFGFLTPFILAGVFIYIAFRDVNLDNLFSIIAESSILWFFVFVVMFYLSHLIRAYRWNVMLSSVKKTSLKNSFGSVMIGYGVNCAVPRLGEVYRALFMGKWEKLSRTQMLGSVIVERFLDILVLLLSVLVSIWAYDGDILQQIPWLQNAMLIVGLFVSIGIAFLLLLVFLREKVKNILINLFSRFSSKLASKMEYIFDMLADGFSTIKDRRTLWITLFLSALIMIVYGINSYFGLLMLHLDSIQSINVGTGWIIMTISAFGIVLPTPGGTGSYHVITKLALVTLYGFSEDVSMAYALMTHSIGIVLFVFTTIMVVFLANLRNRKTGVETVSFISVLKNNSVEE